jgi:hypothetical protein
MAALQGAEQLLAAKRIGAIYMEMGNAESESVAYLTRHGYVGWDIVDSGRLVRLGAHTPWGNALFLPPAGTPPLRDDTRIG